MDELHLVPTSFATDDWLCRVVTFVQMAGVLVLAAGVDSAVTDRDHTLVVGSSSPTTHLMIKSH